MNKRRLILVSYLYTLALFSFTYFYLGYLEIVQNTKPEKIYKNFIDAFGDAIVSIPSGLAQWFWYQAYLLIISILFTLSLKIWAIKFSWFWILPIAILINVIGFIITLFLYHFPGINPWENWYVEVVGLLISAGILIKSIFFSNTSEVYEQ